MPPSAERLRWLTGFTGSAGLAIITRKSAALFVDGRVHACRPGRKSIASSSSFPELPRNRMSEWLLGKLGKAASVGFNPWLHTFNEIETWRGHLAEREVKLKPTSRNLVDQIWGKDRPPSPTHRVIPHPLKHAGRSAADKIADVQAVLREDNQHAAVLTLPDLIAWLFNIRGSDVAHNPVALAFAVVTVSAKPELFITPEKLDREARQHLEPVAKLNHPSGLSTRIKELKDAGRTVRLDPNSAAWGFGKTLGGTGKFAKGADPCIALKARKNTAEIKGARAAHIRDGAAMVRFLAWLDTQAAHGQLDEITAVKQLETFRRETEATARDQLRHDLRQRPEWRHCALPRFRVRPIAGSSRASCFSSTAADSTSTVRPTSRARSPSANPSAEMCERFTLVLKGHISIATARFPKGTRGIDLDPFARRALWDHGLDYDHGTGHGIGSYLSVHEGPQSISRAGMAQLEPGMLCSNEPGYYKEGAYGIRIENVVLVNEPEKAPGGDRPVMSFETLTLAPIDLRLVVKGLLTPAEIAWLDCYHAKVREVLSPLLEAGDRTWLATATRALG